MKVSLATSEETGRAGSSEMSSHLPVQEPSGECLASGAGQGLLDPNQDFREVSVCSSSPGDRQRGVINAPARSKQAQLRVPLNGRFTKVQTLFLKVFR